MGKSKFLSHCRKRRLLLYKLWKCTWISFLKFWWVNKNLLCKKLQFQSFPEILQPLWYVSKLKSCSGFAISEKISPLQKYDVKVMMCRKLPKFWLVGWLVDWLTVYLFIIYWFLMTHPYLFIYCITFFTLKRNMLLFLPVLLCMYVSMYLLRSILAYQRIVIWI